VKIKLILLAMVLLLTGCATKTWLVQPEFNSVNVKRVGVVVPSATVKMIDVVNNVTVDQDLSVAARVALEKGTVDALKEGGFDVFLLSNKEDLVTFQKGYTLLAGQLAKPISSNVCSIKTDNNSR